MVARGDRASTVCLSGVGDAGGEDADLAKGGDGDVLVAASLQETRETAAVNAATVVRSGLRATARL
jgi:hypothetical protein